MFRHTLSHSRHAMMRYAIIAAVAGDVTAVRRLSLLESRCRYA